MKRFQPHSVLVFPTDPSPKTMPARSLDTDLTLALASGANVMLAGRTDGTRNLLDAIEPRLRRPMVSLDCDLRTALPDPRHVRTMVLHDPSALSLADQLRIFDWLTRAKRRVQVISVTSLDIVPLMDAGMFLASLYYRLNVLYVEASTRTDASGVSPPGSMRVVGSDPLWQNLIVRTIVIDTLRSGVGGT